MTVYVSNLQAKLAGAIAADVSESTTATTARTDAAETVEALGDTLTFTYAFTETTAVAERASGTFVAPFNTKASHVSIVMDAGGQTAQGYTNYATFALQGCATDGSTTCTIASWSPKTDTLSIWNEKALVMTPANQVITKGQGFRMVINKVGTGATTGVSMMTAVLRRVDD